MAKPAAGESGEPAASSPSGIPAEDRARSPEAPWSDPRGDAGESRLPQALVPAGTTELGIDIIRVERIRRTLDRFGARFAGRVLTPAERRYVRDRPETLAGRWAAKEAVSKVLGLGVRGVGWRDIEVLPNWAGQPQVTLHDRAAARAARLGLEEVSVSISH